MLTIRCTSRMSDSRGKGHSDPELLVPRLSLSAASAFFAQATKSVAGHKICSELLGLSWYFLDRT